jgi:hypothetical protein
MLVVSTNMISLSSAISLATASIAFAFDMLSSTSIVFFVRSKNWLHVVSFSYRFLSSLLAMASSLLAIHPLKVSLNARAASSRLISLDVALWPLDYGGECPCNRPLLLGWRWPVPCHSSNVSCRPHR